MRKIIIATILLLSMLSLCSCGSNEMSYEEYQQFSSMEDELKQYHSLDEYHILTEDEESDIYKELSDKYGEDVTEDVIDIFYTYTHELGNHIN